MGESAYLYISLRRCIVPLFSSKSMSSKSSWRSGPHLRHSTCAGGNLYRLFLPFFFFFIFHSLIWLHKSIPNTNTARYKFVPSGYTQIFISEARRAAFGPAIGTSIYISCIYVYIKCSSPVVCPSKVRTSFYHSVPFLAAHHFLVCFTILYRSYGQSKCLASKSLRCSAIIHDLKKK